MSWKHGIVGATYALSVMLGNVCLLNITYAIAPPAPTDSPAISRVDATECPWVKLQSDDQKPPQKSPCESGHCITTPPPEISCFALSDKEIPPAMLPAQAPELLLTIDRAHSPQPKAAESPPFLPGVTTVVLRR